MRGRFIAARFRDPSILEQSGKYFIELYIDIAWI